MWALFSRLFLLSGDADNVMETENFSMMVKS